MSMDIAPDERRRIHAATHPSYRPDIDGLRALAVVPVVLNHALVMGFRGGYVGVDIFYVISGYLITGILVRDLAIGRHSIAEFYRRRVLRIFPALFVMIAVSTLFACVAMLPEELERYARSVAATTLFSSNFLFYSETGYFDAASTVKPLLHTWSLAIEEQFYIVWPLMLAAIGGTRRHGLVIAIVATTIVSFGISVVMLPVDMSATFYLLPARAWELSLGATLSLLPVNPIRKRWINELLGLAGLAAILVCLPLYDEGTPFPGPAAALPCVGAALLILTGASGNLAGRLLSLKPAVFIGWISYSLYLWHWPVIVFAKIWLFVPLADPVAKVAEVTLSVLLATLSWRFVERPFRSVPAWPTPRVLWTAAGVMAVSLAIAGALLLSGGLGWRFTPEQRKIGSYLSVDGDQLYRRGTCFAVSENMTIRPECLVRKTNRPTVLLLGDSHSAHLWPGLSQHPRFEVLQANMIGCRPILVERERLNCEAFERDMLLRWAPAHKPAAVILAGSWRLHDMAALERTLSDPRIRALNPILVGPIPRYTAQLPRLLVYSQLGREQAAPARNHVSESFETDAAEREIARRHDVPYVSLVRLLCPKGGDCRTLVGPGVPLQYDTSHLTAPGSILIAATLAPIIEREIAEGQGARP
ncbi:acyltransferase family protein [Sphingomonas sp. ID0503]|uniref:acyltransferase family protein n=1 Tax=Sphingomonas sp. ID0503 TaxID=3399691 RepID=UPI003AFA047A